MLRVLSFPRGFIHHGQRAAPQRGFVRHLLSVAEAAGILVGQLNRRGAGDGRRSWDEKPIARLATMMHASPLRRVLFLQIEPAVLPLLACCNSSVNPRPCHLLWFHMQAQAAPELCVAVPAAKLYVTVVCRGKGLQLSIDVDQYQYIE